ncbi:hypothetical protein [Nocardioides cynanchi]|uniref:hypothetical protein n=1 Tax=Nocardioides cynanchi TaxID=2558918 RepID=UPI00124534E5|nr:hypothetical protein [Nocardioides cynanchi]
MRTRLATLAALGAAVATVALPAHASARPAGKPDVACMHAGIKTLQSAGLLDDVARGGLPIATAVALGVTPRAGTDVSALPDPLPLSVVLADHRAGSSSLFVYPWC